MNELLRQLEPTIQATARDIAIHVI